VRKIVSDWLAIWPDKNQLDAWRFKHSAVARFYLNDYAVIRVYDETGT
jgi:hypothetical protein